MNYDVLTSRFDWDMYNQIYLPQPWDVIGSLKVLSPFQVLWGPIIVWIVQPGSSWFTTGGPGGL